MSEVQVPEGLSYDVVIGLPIYNGENYAHACIDSILAQTYQNFILMIVDNASTDGTQRICEEYRDRDRRVIYVRNEVNIGGPQNFVRAYQIAPPSTFYRWQSHDDLISPTFLEDTIATLRENEHAICCHGRSIVIDDDGNEVESDDAPYDRLRSPVPSHRLFAFTMKGSKCCEFYGVFRRTLLDKVRPLGIFQGADRSFLADTAMIAPILTADRPVFYNRDHQMRYSRATIASKEKLMEFCRPPGGKAAMAGRFRLYGALYSAWWRGRGRMNPVDWLRCLPWIFLAPFRWPEPRTALADLAYIIHPRFYEFSRGVFRTVIPRGR